MVPQEMMPMHMNMNPGMAQPHHIMPTGMPPHMGMPPNPMHHEHMPQPMYNNSESAYHHHMQSLGQHVPPQHVPQQLQQLPVQQPILPCTSESQIVSNSVPYSDPIMPPVHLEQPLQMPSEQQPQQQQQPPQLQQQEQQQQQLQQQLQQDQLQQQMQQSPIMPSSPVESESQGCSESPLIEQINQSPQPQSEAQSPLPQTEVKEDSNQETQSPNGSPDVKKSVLVENDNTSIGSHQSRSLSPAELNEPQSLERGDCWSGSEQDPPPPTLTAEVSPPTSPKSENETIETSVFNFTEDEDPPPPLHSLPDGSPRKLKGLPKY
jgi:hypothetical protein